MCSSIDVLLIINAMDKIKISGFSEQTLPFYWQIHCGFLHKWHYFAYREINVPQLMTNEEHVLCSIQLSQTRKWCWDDILFWAGMVWFFEIGQDSGIFPWPSFSCVCMHMSVCQSLFIPFVHVSLWKWRGVIVLHHWFFLPEMTYGNEHNLLLALSR